MSADITPDIQSSTGTRPRRVLVIDDNPAIHTDFRKLLGKEETNDDLDRISNSLFGDPVPAGNRPVFELDSAFQGQEGLEAVEKAIACGNPFQMAFVDVRMPPGWDGIETMERLWKVDPDLEIVISTAYSDYDLDELTSKFGYSDKFYVLKKPFEKIEVVQLATACTQKRFLREQVREQARKLEHRAACLQRAHDTLEERVEERTEELHKFSQAIEQSPVAVVITNTRGEIEYSNPEFSRTSGYTAEEARGLNPSVLKSGLTSVETYRTLWETIKRGEVWQGEFCNRHKDGSLYWESATIAPLRSQEGETTHYIAVKQDISELYRTSQAYQESQARLNQLLSVAQDPIVILDDEGKICLWNQAAVRTFEYSVEEAAGRELGSLIIPAEQRTEFAASLSLCINAPEANGEKRELTAMRKNRELLAVELSLAAVKLHGKSSVIGILRDITQRKRAERQLMETNRELEMASALANDMAVKAELASAAKSQFLANMSHEIRTPLNGVIGITELLLGCHLTDEQRQYALMAQNSGQALLSIINDILDFSKIEAGKMDLEAIDFDLRAPLEEATEILATRAMTKGLQIISLTDPSVPKVVRGDPVRFRQILLNLGGNAVKFTSAGEVVLHLGLERKTEHKVTIRVTITDTGVGIEEDKLHLLFAPFVQIDSSTTRKFGGTGLGLAISKQLSELMGGKIGVTSRKGKGSQFWFTAALELPAVQEAIPEVSPAAGLRVLLVDPHPTVRMSLGLMLESLGCGWAEASDKASCLSTLAQRAQAGKRFDLVLLDKSIAAQEPDLAAQIRREFGGGVTQVVLITGLSLSQSSESTASPELECLTKPVRLAALQHCLERAKTGSLVLSPPPRPKAEKAVTQEPSNVALILVADDSPTNQVVAVKFLEKMGHKADAVINGAQALKALRDKRYDLVLMDGQMPEMDGLEATREIRAGKSGVLNPSIPIVGLTASAFKEDRERCLKAGMDDYLQKPLDAKILAQVVTQWLKKNEPPQTQGQEQNGNPQKPQTPTESHSSTLEPIFDRADLMDRLMGDEELEESMLSTYLSDLPQQLEMFKSAMASGNPELVSKAAHRIKGAASSVSAKQLQQLAHQIETAAKNNDRRLLTELGNRIPEFAASLQGELNRRAEVAS